MDTKAALGVYRELADHYEQQEEPSLRDRFLVLAADAALAAALPAEAERLRQRLLQVNPHHLLKPYKSFVEAIRAPDIQTYIHDLRENYPLETAKDLLRSVRAGKLLDALQEEQDIAPAAKARPIAVPANATPVEAMPVYRVHPETPTPRKPIPVVEPHYQPASSRAARENAGRKDPPPAKSSPKAAAPAKPQRAAASLRPAPAEPEAPASGSWFASALFGFFVVACAALAAYTLARPFLPPDWVP